jgi:hypothetical protein
MLLVLPSHGRGVLPADLQHHRVALVAGIAFHSESKRAGRH